jgi:hypothetical protein
MLCNASAQRSDSNSVVIELRGCGHTLVEFSCLGQDKVTIGKGDLNCNDGNRLSYTWQPSDTKDSEDMYVVETYEPRGIFGFPAKKGEHMKVIISFDSTQRQFPQYRQKVTVQGSPVAAEYRDFFDKDFGFGDSIRVTVERMTAGKKPVEVIEIKREEMFRKLFDLYEQKIYSTESVNCACYALSAMSSMMKDAMTPRRTINMERVKKARNYVINKFPGSETVDRLIVNCGRCHYLYE